MKKLKAMIDKAWDYGKLPHGVTPYMMERLLDIYTVLSRKEQVEFIESGINDILTRCGIKTRRHGIGWIAYR